MKTIVIAEIGPNHNGSINLAKKLISAAKRSGADYVKFQTFIAEDMITISAKKANYQKKETSRKDNQFKMLKKLQLSFKDFIEIKKFSKKIGIKFLTTCFDFKSVKFAKKLKMDYFKIASGEIDNYPLIKQICKIAKKIILSTGMSDFKQVKETVTYILKNNFKRQNIVLLHCNTEYPTPYKDVNLRAMIEMKNKLKIKNFGYSDHTLGTLVPLASVAMGANYIEKHFTLNKKYKGPDHKASMEPHEFKEMMNKIRLLEKILGSKQKIITNSEKKKL